MDTVFCGHYGHGGYRGHFELWTVDTAAAKNGDKWVIKCEQSFSQKERRVGRKKKETTNEASRHFGGGGVSRGTI